MSNAAGSGPLDWGGTGSLNDVGWSGGAEAWSSSFMMSFNIRVNVVGGRDFGSYLFWTGAKSEIRGLSIYYLILIAY